MTFKKGFKQGIPIGIGYLAVSFAFGVLAINGITPLMSTLTSLLVFTGAGQFAGVTLMLKNASYLEIAIALILMNLRYLLMSLSLSQKIDPKTSTIKRLIMAQCITYETFGVAVTEKEQLNLKYMVGLALAPLLGWVIGTAIGSLSATLFSERLLEALNIAIYAMYISICLPDAKKSLPIIIVILISVGISCLFEYVPGLNTISSGFKVIIATLVASTIGALIFPIKDEEEVKDGESHA